MSEGQQKKTLGIAIASLVFGCLFIVPFLGIMFSLTAVILGIIALVKIGNNKETLKGRGMAIWGIVLGVACPIILSILAAIAISMFEHDLLRNRLNINEVVTQTEIRTIAAAIEAYATANDGKYPLSESELIDAHPAYLKQAYNDKTILGYTYSLNFNADTYEIIAKPEQCMSTGTKVFINRNGKISESRCTELGRYGQRSSVTDERNQVEQSERE